MTRPLLSLLLVANFGRGSRRPLRAAALRLLAAAAAGTALGLTLARALEDAPLPPGLPTAWLAATLAAGAFALTALALLSLAAASSRQRDILPKLAAVLPLGRASHWALELVPLSLVWLLGLTVAVPVVLALADAADAPARPLLAAALAGSLAGLGLVALPRPRSAPVKSLIIIALTLASSRLLTIYLQAEHPHRWPLLALATLLALPLAGLPASFLWAGRAHPAQSSSTPLFGLPAGVLRHGWGLLKLLRNSRTLISLFFCLAVMFATAAAVAARHLAPIGGPSWLLIGAVLAAALSCDVRGLAPRHRAPEIEALHGPGRFVATETTAALTLTLILGLPMLVVLAAGHLEISTPTLVAIYITLQTAATLIGLLASTLFVPGAGDLGSQFFAAASATTLLFALPKLLHFSGLHALTQAGIWLTIAAACFAIIQLIEHQRRLT